LLVNTPTGGINAVEGKVRGLVSTSMKAFDDNMLRVTSDLARELLRTKGAHLWVVTLQRTEQTDSVMAQLHNTPSLKAFEILPWHKLADFYNKTVELFTRQMGVVKFIIAVIIVLSISNTMTMSVMERTVEIGTSMALGVRKRRIMRLFLLEGGLLGAIGGLCGVTLGYLLAQAISAIGIPMPPAPGMSRGFIAGIIITPQIVIEALTLAVSTTLIASIYPAWRASRLVIVDALRHNR
jgi:putative ABC transport system permease protein